MLEVTRPDDADIPEVQETSLLPVYKGMLYEIPLTISYEINFLYDPRGCNAYWDNLEAQMLAAETATAEALAELEEITTAEALTEQETSSEVVEADTAVTLNDGSDWFVVAGAVAILALGVGGWLFWKQRKG